jgi:alkylhydroperoxidase family enzyme
MLKPIILKVLAREEKKLGASLDYVRHILRTSLRAFFKFGKVLPLSEYRRVLPVDAHFTARLVAARDADCGSCVQIEVNLARKAGMSVDLLKSVVAERPNDLPLDLAEVYRFAQAVVEARDDEDLRQKMRDRYGEEGLVELALAMAACRVFPIVKRTLGYAKSCSAVGVQIPASA